MRHNVAGRKFGRTANQRKALFRSLAGAVIKYERIETTVAKAKETRRIVEKLVTLAKRGDVHAKRLAMAKLPNRDLVVKLFDVIAPRFADRPGGYMRIVHTRQRVNDRADMAVLEFVDFEDLRDKSAKPAKKKAAPAAKPAAKAEPKKEETKAEEAKEEKTEAKKKAAPKEKEEAADEDKPAAKKKAPAKKKAAPAKKKAASDEEKPAAKKKAPAKKKAAPAKKKAEPKGDK